MNTVETVRTTKGCYSLTAQVVKQDEHIYTLLSIGDSYQETFIRIDEEDMRRLGLLFADHLPKND